MVVRLLLFRTHQLQKALLESVDPASMTKERTNVEFLRCYSYLGSPRYSYLDSDAPDELSHRLIAPRSLLPVARRLPLFLSSLLLASHR